ncbi:sensor histidine kinase [Nocardioides houyundeii]|uniref:sensor histidine kinase n=1 Tax=Nocardioides houyundeii TaxID=2045452 RepID=UPI000C770F36|nr:ATP-binding protein [Nocardioides houyundeii]
MADKGESVEPAATDTGARGRGFWVLWSVTAAIFTLGVLLSRTTADPGQLPRLWLLSGAAFFWMAFSWRGVLPRLTRVFVLTVVLVFVLGVLVALDVDVSIASAVRNAAALGVQSLLLCAGYRWARALLRSDPPDPAPGAARWRRELALEWAPGGARDLSALMLAAALSALAVVPVFGVPSLVGDDAGARDVADWVIRVCVTSLVSVTALLAVATWSRQETSRRALLLPLIGTASLLLLVVALESDAVPLVWVVLLPSLYVASTFPVWTTAAYSLGLGFGCLMIYPFTEQSGRAQPVVPDGYVIDLLVSVCAFVALTIALLNEHRNRLLRDLEAARRTAIRQTTMLRRVFEAMSDGFVVISPSADIRVHNQSAVDLLGRPLPDLSPRNWVDYFGLTRPDGAALDNDELLHTELLAVQPPTGPRRVLRQRVVPLDGHPRDGVMISLTDVTHQHERLGELSSFAGVVAHDLRAPLSSLEGWLELVGDALEHGRPDEAVALLMRARAANQRMQEIVADWLHHTVDLEGELRSTDFPLANPVAVVVSTHVGTGGHRFTVEVPHRVHADLAMVRQLMDNLVGNACKYTRPGQVAEVAITSTPGEPGWVRVDVADRGIGLPPGEEERIFEKFHRAAEHARDYQGSGVGLDLCRQIVERHGGRIHARANDHGGTTVSFTLPAARSPR